MRDSNSIGLKRLYGVANGAQLAISFFKLKICNISPFAVRHHTNKQTMSEEEKYRTKLKCRRKSPLNRMDFSI